MKINVARLLRIGTSRWTAAVVATLAINQSALAQCNGGPMTPRGGPQGAAATLGTVNLGQVQQLAVILQQQALLQQQQRMAASGPRLAPVRASSVTRQSVSSDSKPSKLSSSSTSRFVETAQERREAYLRLRRNDSTEVLPNRVGLGG